MEFNADNCKVLHLRKSNQGRNFTVNSRAPGSLVEQKDLRVQVHRFLNMAWQIDRVVKKAFGSLAFII